MAKLAAGVALILVVMGVVILFGAKWMTTAAVGGPGILIDPMGGESCAATGAGIVYGVEQVFSSAANNGYTIVSNAGDTNNWDAVLNNKGEVVAAKKDFGSSQAWIELNPAVPLHTQLSTGNYNGQKVANVRSVSKGGWGYQVHTQSSSCTTPTLETSNAGGNKITTACLTGFQEDQGTGNLIPVQGCFTTTTNCVNLCNQINMGGLTITGCSGTNYPPITSGITPMYTQYDCVGICNACFA